MKQRGQGAIEFCLISLVVVIVAMAAVALVQEAIKNLPSAVQATEHVIQRRGVELSSQLEDCFNNSGEFMATAYNRQTGRMCDVYLGADGKYNLHIYDETGTRTMIQKEKMTNIFQVMKYLFNGAYEFILRLF